MEASAGTDEGRVKNSYSSVFDEGLERKTVEYFLPKIEEGLKNSSSTDIPFPTGLSRHRKEVRRLIEDLGPYEVRVRSRYSSNGENSGSFEYSLLVGRLG